MRRSGRACGAMEVSVDWGGFVLTAQSQPCGLLLRGSVWAKRVSVRFVNSRFRVWEGVAGQGFAGGGTVGMQPSRKREGNFEARGNPEGRAADWSRLRRDGGVERLGRFDNRSLENRVWFAGPRGNRSLSAADAAFVRGSEAGARAHGTRQSRVRAASGARRRRAGTSGRGADSAAVRHVGGRLGPLTFGG